jgi:hypothetical protein
MEDGRILSDHMISAPPSVSIAAGSGERHG